MSAELLPCLEIEPDRPASAAVIWLHGLGADGSDFVSIVPHLALGPDLAVRFVFPHAPAMPVTINMGMSMPAWYDITGVELRHRQDHAGIARSAARVRNLIAREVERGVPAQRIVLAGFSQGGAIATFTALRHPRALAGAVALSTYLLAHDTLDAEIAAANRNLPVFVGHGTQDPMVPFVRGTEMRDELVRIGCDVTWRSYPMQHQVCMEEIEDIGAWLRARLG